MGVIDKLKDYWYLVSKEHSKLIVFILSLALVYPFIESHRHFVWMNLTTVKGYGHSALLYQGFTYTTNERINYDYAVKMTATYESIPQFIV